MQRIFTVETYIKKKPYENCRIKFRTPLPGVSVRSKSSTCQSCRRSSPWSKFCDLSKCTAVSLPCVWVRYSCCLPVPASPFQWTWLQVCVISVASILHRLQSADCLHYIARCLGQDCSVGIAHRYGLEGPQIESRKGERDEIFRSRPDLLWGPPTLLYNGYRASLQGVKQPGRGVDHPLPSSAKVKERVELYFYSSYGPSWPVLGWNEYSLYNAWSSPRSSSL